MVQFLKLLLHIPNLSSILGTHIEMEKKEMTSYSCPLISVCLYVYPNTYYMHRMGYYIIIK